MKAGVFQAIYIICFCAITILAIKIFDHSNSFEMMSYAIWGCIIFIPVSLLGWLIINPISAKISDPIYHLISKVLLSLLYINGLFLIFSGGHFASEVLVAINAIHLSSFAIASTIFLNALRKQK